MYKPLAFCHWGKNGDNHGANNDVINSKTLESTAAFFSLNNMNFC